MDGANGAPASDALSERTPLLPSRRSTRRDLNEELPNSIPHIGTVAAGIRLEDLATYTVDELFPATLTSRSARTAFALCVLLYYRKSILEDKASRGRDIWSKWHEKAQHSEGLRVLDSLTVRVWALFLEEDGTADEIADVLWISHPVDTFSARTIRVIDFLEARHAPEDLVTHPLIQLSLVDTWKHGRRSRREGEGAVSSLLRFVDSCGAPRVLYIMELAAHFAYLWILWDYVNRIRDFEPLPHAFVMSYPLGMLFHPWSPSTFPSILVFLSLFLRFPHAPTNHSFELSCILLSLYVDFIFLHFPFHNSPLHLLRPEKVLPLAVLAWRGLHALFIPTVFFLPGLMITLSLFGQSLRNWSLWALASFTPHDMSGPTDTQWTFLWLLFTLFLFTVTSLIYAATVNPHLAASRGPETSTWDRYTRSVGLDARRAFIRAVRVYGADNYLPAPLNLVQVIIVRILRRVLNLLGARGAVKKLEGVDQAVWRIMVTPFAFLISGLWLWHLRAS